MKFSIKKILLLVCIGLLAACGGGGGGSGSGMAPTTPSGLTPTQSAEGLWSGTRTNTSSSQIAYALISNDGSYYVVYLTSGQYSSFAAGTSAVLSTTISSTDYASYNLLTPLAPVVNGSVAGTVSTKGSLAAQISYTGGSPAPDTLTLTYDSQYDSGSALSTTVGTYSYSANGITPTYVFSVDSNGVITGSTSSGCQFTGQLSIRSASKNLYDVSITTGSGCSFIQTLTGLATYTTLPSDTAKTLILAASKHDSSLTYVFFAAGKH